MTDHSSKNSVQDTQEDAVELDRPLTKSEILARRAQKQVETWLEEAKDEILLDEKLEPQSVVHQAIQISIEDTDPIIKSNAEPLDKKAIEDSIYQNLLSGAEKEVPIEELEVTGQIPHHLSNQGQCEGSSIPIQNQDFDGAPEIPWTIEETKMRNHILAFEERIDNIKPSIHLKPIDSILYKRPYLAGLIEQTSRIGYFRGEEISKPISLLKLSIPEGETGLEFPNSAILISSRHRPIELNPATMEALIKLIEGAKAGSIFEITSSFRSFEEQKVLYKRFHQGNGNPADAPGHSGHHTGLEFDMHAMNQKAASGLSARATKLGFVRPDPNVEKWHFEHRAGLKKFQATYRNKETILAKNTSQD